jgi:hypothetical protein
LKTRNNKSIKDSMEEINNINNNRNNDNGDSGNNNRGVAVVNRFHYLAKEVVLRYSFATIRFLKWKINELKIRIEENDAIIRYDGWRIPQVESNLQDARRSFQDEK